MLLFPAIDILGGQVVRLFQGDYAQSEVFGANPVEFARRFKEQGAKYLHVVDLDGARCGAPRNLDIVREIAAETGLFIEFGGGVRGEEDFLRALGAGVSRVIVGTAALKSPGFVRRMAQEHGERLAVGVDARGGKVAVEGWLETSDTDSLTFCEYMRGIGVRHVIYTDIARDGAQRGANLDIYRRLAAMNGLCVTASGGVSCAADIEALRDMGIWAAILGKALYTGALSLADALRAAAGEGRSIR